jgi:zinc protease
MTTTSLSVRRGAALAICGGILGLGLAALPAQGADTMNIPYKSFTLPNGLEVLVHEDHTLPVVTVNTWYHVGSGDEKPGRTGFAHLFEHIMFMGSQHVPTGEFDKLLEAAGAENNGSTTGDRTNYYEDGPSNALPLMMYLDGDRMGYLLPEINKEKVDLQRDVVKNERRQRYENEPYGLAQENIQSRLFPAGHPYNWTTIGSMADLSAASIDDVRDFFKTYYTPNNATIAVAGDVTTADVKQWAEKYFSDIPKGPDIARPKVADFKLPADVHYTLEDRVQLPRVYDALHTVKAFSADDAPLEAVAGVLADGKSSRLYKRLIYDLQIASNVVAYQRGGQYDGLFVLYATARPGHDLNELQRVIDEEIKKLADSGPTDRELQRFKNATEAQFIDVLEHVGGFDGKANQLNYYRQYAGTPDYMAKDIERYRNLTAADVQRAAKQYLAGPHRVVVSVVPKGDTKLAVTPGVTP